MSNLKMKSVYLDEALLGEAGTMVEAASVAGASGYQVDPHRPAASLYGIYEGPTAFRLMRNRKSEVGHVAL